MPKHLFKQKASVKTKINLITKKLFMIKSMFMQKDLFNKKTNLHIHLLPMNIIKRDDFKFSPKPIQINGI